MFAHRSVIVIDKAQSNTASRVAAGLITPVTGRRMTVAPGFPSLRHAARQFFRRVEEHSGATLLRVTPARRLFQDDEERDRYIETSNQSLAVETEPFADAAGLLVGFDMPRAMRLDVPRFLDATRRALQERGTWIAGDICCDDLVPEQDSIRVPRLQIAARRVAFCTGWTGLPNPWFPGVPDGPARGEILRVRLRDKAPDRILHRGIWLVPEVTSESGPANEFLLGATYDRSDLTSGPTEQGRTELLAGLAGLTNETPEIVDHLSAVRAGQRDRQPVARLSADDRRIGILNGLGSRGALLAPALAERLWREWDSPRPATPAASKRPAKSLTAIAHTIVGRVVQPGDTVIDATAGNGHDTLFLALRVGSCGKVLAIDIQPAAIDATAKRLRAGNVDAGRVELIAGDHAVELEQCRLTGLTVRAVMFNLGYLPGGSKAAVTQTSTTVAAIRTARAMLMPGGVMTVIAYRGHPGGLAEAQAVEAELLAVDPERTDQIDSDPANPASPVLFVYRAPR
jgi:glycine/D-amino acid oxidase-like deaminating enzyme/23S rRNA U2552 (ribose-2'-O)-methylase RlmE/FtsJ